MYMSMSKKTNHKLSPGQPAVSAGLRARIAAVLANFGLLAIMVAALFPLLRLDNSSMRYIYVAGAALLVAGRIVTPKVKDMPLRLRRLIRMEFWTALIFVVGAVFLFLPSAGHTDWLAFTLAGAVLTVYTSIMIPRIKK